MSNPVELLARLSDRNLKERLQNIEKQLNKLSLEVDVQRSFIQVLALSFPKTDEARKNLATNVGKVLQHLEVRDPQLAAYFSEVAGHFLALV